MSGEIVVSQLSASKPPQAPVASSPPASPAADPIAVQAASKRPLVNPSLHLDLALNLVVLQFVDDKGEVTNSIPSEKQLKAYKSQQTAPAAQTPRGVRPSEKS